MKISGISGNKKFNFSCSPKNERFLSILIFLFGIICVVAYVLVTVLK